MAAKSDGNFIYTTQNLRRVHPPAKEVLKDLSLCFFFGAKIGVIGGNGAGKSSLLRIMAGLDTDFFGHAAPADGVTIGYLPQEPELDPSKNVFDNVMEGVRAIKASLDRFNEINAKLCDPDLDPEEMATLCDELAKVQDHIDATGGWEIERTIEQAMDALRCPPGDADVSTLSGGEKRRVALCKLLLEKPDLLLLDEPTNHLDAESVAWLEHHLQTYPGTVIAITHDRYFLDNIAEWILELDRGEGYPFKGNYSSWLEQKRKRLELEEKAESARQRTLARELEWVRMAPRARQAKSKARLSAYEHLLAETNEKREATAELSIPTGPRLGDDVIIARGLTKSFGDKLLFDNLDFRLPPGGIVGVIGPNGAGKTTLFRMIMGLERPDAGELVIGPTVKLSYVDQNRSELEPEDTIYKAISQGEDFIRVGRAEINARAWCGAFGFKGADQQKKVKGLSGGERNRLHLARTLRAAGNVLLLDEPTNDLDVDTLRALEEGIVDFPGCAVIVSHDRWFLDRIATHILAFEGESRVVWFEGNYQDYEADKRRRLGAEAEIPKRIKYRKLTG